MSPDGYFRPIRGFPNYLVNPRGRVWSWNRNRFLTGSTDRGYKRVNLHGSDGVRCRKVHRLVLEAFRGPCPAGMESRHLNGNPADNRLENLEWADHQTNIADKARHRMEREDESRKESS